MSRIASGAAVMVALSSALPDAGTTAPGVAQSVHADPYDLLEVICDRLGPDTFVFPGLPVAARTGDEPDDVTVGWIDVVSRSGENGEYRSHHRLLQAEPPEAVDAICSFDLDGEQVDLTVTMGFRLRPA